MHLSQQEIHTFYKLWYALVWGVNEKHKVIPHFTRPKYGTRVSVSMEEFIQVRDAMWDNPEWIDEFLAKHDNGEFTEQERGIIAKWRMHFIKDDFIVIKHLSKYTVLMTMREEPIYLYGVHGISNSLQDSFSNQVPFPVKLVLLPWGDRIIYDSLAMASNISFGAGWCSTMKEWYGISKEKYGIIETLGAGNPAARFPTSKQSKPTTKATATSESAPTHANVPKAMTDKYNEIAEIVTRFADEKLNEEYKELLLKVLAKLCRKRPSPLLKGRTGTWACGIVYAVGSNNFIFDKSQEINMTATEIAQWFGLSKGTAANKASEIIHMLQMSQMDAEYLLKSLVDESPATWLFNIDGFIIDIRMAPYDIQKDAYERGLIPYIPADRE